jgi:hypothetical protein
MEKRGPFRKKWNIELQFRKIEGKSVIAPKKAVPTIR